MTDYEWKRPSMNKVINRVVDAKEFPLSNKIHSHKGSNSLVGFPQGFGFLDLFSMEWWWWCVIKLCKNQGKWWDFITLRSCLLGSNCCFWPALACAIARHKLWVSLSWKKTRPRRATASCSTGSPLHPFSCPDNQDNATAIVAWSSARARSP